MSDFKYKTYKCVWIVEKGYYLDEIGLRTQVEWTSVEFPTKAQAEKELTRVAVKNQWGSWRPKEDPHNGYQWVEIRYKEVLIDGNLL